MKTFVKSRIDEPSPSKNANGTGFDVGHSNLKRFVLNFASKHQP